MNKTNARDETGSSLVGRGQPIIRAGRVLMWGEQSLGQKQPQGLTVRWSEAGAK